jgi:hypothetical protein
VDLRERRELHNGFGESLSRAFELALTPAIFGWLGWWLDGRLGTRPLFLLVLFGLTVVWLAYKNFSRFGADLRAQQERIYMTPAQRAEHDRAKGAR